MRRTEPRIPNLATACQVSGLFSALCTVDIGGAIAYMSQASLGFGLKQVLVRHLGQPTGKARRGSPAEFRRV